MSKHALVTGCDGFVGRHMRQRLLDDGWHVIGIEKSLIETDAWSGALTLFSTIDTVFDLVVHAAARSPHRAGIDRDHGSFAYNTLLDAALFEWAIRTKQRRVVYLSSSAVYPRAMQDVNSAHIRLNEQAVNPHRVVHPPFDDYGWTKIGGERLADAARQAGVLVSVVRPFSGYGEDQSTDFPFGAFAQRVRERQSPFQIWGSMHQTRDWIHIDDVISGILAVVEHDTTHPVNLCTGLGTSMFSVVRLMHAAAGVDMPLCETMAAAPLGVMHRVGDPDRMALHYVPKITLEEGVRRAFELR